MSQTIQIWKSGNDWLENKIKELKELFKANTRNHWKIAEIVHEILRNCNGKTIKKIARELMLRPNTLYIYAEIFEHAQRLLQYTTKEEVEFLKSQLPFFHWKEVLSLNLTDTLNILRTAIKEKWNRDTIRMWRNLNLSKSTQEEQKAEKETIEVLVKALKEVNKTTRTLSREEILEYLLRMILHDLNTKKVYCPKCGSNQLVFPCCNLTIEEALAILEKNKRKAKAIR
jgi:hypothetical protein